MKLILCAIARDLHLEMNHFFKNTANVEVHLDDILAFKADAIVSPANSFGFMDGGIDAHYTKAFGPGLQHRLQNRIRMLPHGELLVGNALSVSTGSMTIPFLVSAPTMRLPMRIVDTSQIRLATRAALRCARADGAESLLMPGMGTGAGGVPAFEGARQMRLGYEDEFGGKPFPPSWQEAYNR